MKFFALLLLFSTATSAQQTWNFTSGAMTVVSGSGPTGPITGTVTLATPLPANGATLVTPTSFSFASPLGFLNSAFLAAQSNPQTQNGNASASFSFVTVNGQITAWTVIINSLWGQSQGGDEYEYLTLSSSSGNNYQGSFDSLGPCNAGVATCYTVEATSAAGTWVDPPAASCPVPAPTPPAPTPAPSGVQGEQCSPVVALATPSNSLMMYVSPNANGSPRECQKPGTTPKNWFIKTTTNGGQSFSYAMTLEQLSLGN
jgi:hypothetical protein